MKITSREIRTWKGKANQSFQTGIFEQDKQKNSGKDERNIVSKHLEDNTEKITGTMVESNVVLLTSSTLCLVEDMENIVVANDFVNRILPRMCFYILD